MGKFINTDKKIVKRDLKIITLVILSPIIILILAIVIFFAIRPIVDQIDHNKFSTLDSQMQGLYDKIKKAEGKANDGWKYQAICAPKYNGDFETGTYNCKTFIYVEKTIKSISEYNYYHDKYFPTIDDSSVWDKQKSSALTTNNDFGKKFVVSMGEKNYVEQKTGLGCRYSIQINQLQDNEEYLTTNNTNFGSPIKSGEGDFFVVVRCGATANQAWYTISDDADLIVP